MTSLQVLHNSHFPVSDSVHFKHRSYVCIMKLVLTICGKQKAYRTVVCNNYASAWAVRVIRSDFYSQLLQRI